MNAPDGAADRSGSAGLPEEQARDILRRLRRDATLFGDGASAYEAGLEDAVRALVELAQPAEEQSAAG